MKVTTLRLPEGLYDDLVGEAEAEGRSFSEYVRMLLRNREPNTNTNAHTPPNTDEYAELQERLTELEDRVDGLDAPADGDAGQTLNQQDGGKSGGVLVNSDRPAPEELRSPDANPHSQTVQEAVEWAKQHEPVQRADIIAAFEDDVEIKGDSLWKRHIRDALKEAGFGHDRSGGVATWRR